MGKRHRVSHKLNSDLEGRIEPGAPPGTLTQDPHAVKTKIDVIAYGPDQFLEQELDDLSIIANLLNNYPVVWINVDGLSAIDKIQEIAHMFQLHPLAVEDVVNCQQRPKVEIYGKSQFIVTRMISLNAHLQIEQLSMFLGKNYIISFQEIPGDCLNPLRDRLRKGYGHMRSQGTDQLAYGILDAVVDGYFPVLETYGERLEDLEDEILSNPSRHTINLMHDLKRNLLLIRRAVWPMRETINELIRDESPLITNDTRVYLRDTYDHVVRVMDFIETYRELCSDLMDVYLSSVSNRTNEVMKVLTIIATIFIPPTFIAGIYGMNFHTETSPWNMPELSWYFGYPFSLLLMFLVTVAMLTYLVKRGWLGQAIKAPMEEAKEKDIHPEHST
ncbi:MAG: magnesium/cobalt transporter CorA [Candidatus Obscuribacterales bacterium]|nr:magnesium/cobalt transporter CorA [Candidatus Obscuribacterales bacterium]